MPDTRPNQVARMVAVLALIGAFFLVVVVVATSGDGSGDDEASKTQTVGEGPSKRAKKAVANGVWIVREGDTLAGISEQTGIDVDELLQLNPDLDPQALLQGQRIALR
jgi:LysM repeat protein